MLSDFLSRMLPSDDGLDLNAHLDNTAIVDSHSAMVLHLIVASQSDQKGRIGPRRCQPFSKKVPTDRTCSQEQDLHWRNGLYDWALKQSSRRISMRNGATKG